MSKISARAMSKIVLDFPCGFDKNGEPDFGCPHTQIDILVEKKESRIEPPKFEESLSLYCHRSSTDETTAVWFWRWSAKPAASDLLGDVVLRSVGADKSTRRIHLLGSDDLIARWATGPPWPRCYCGVWVKKYQPVSI